MPSPPPAAVRGVALAAGASLVGLTYAVAETRAFTLRKVEVALLPAGSAPLRVLHLSDLHLTPRQRRKRAWVQDLGRLEPDLVVTTGDNLAHPRALPFLLSAYGPLLARPGVFVLGSNDYFSPTLRNPLGYLLPDRGKRHTSSTKLPWRDLKAALARSGWVDLSNRRDSLTVAGLRLAFAGVDDPHLAYDDLAAVAGPADASADVRIGVTHAPYLRVLDQFADDGYDLTFAGHTHGGQVCLPSGRALVTNCDLDTARARGLHRHPADWRSDELGRMWLHVSAGLGTSPYAQVRFCCRPEATLLTLTERTTLPVGGFSASSGSR